MLDERFWRDYFKVYDILNLVIPYQNLMTDLERALELEADDVVLDVGSGTGNLMIKIKNKCKEVVGVDYSQEGIEIHKLKDLSASVIVHNVVDKLPFPDNYFSKIVSNNTIYTLTESQQMLVLSEIHRVMRPGGKFVISNVKKEFSPFRIYFEHFLSSVKQSGFFKSIFLIFRMIMPTLKMFYYNNKIKKNGFIEYNFFEHDEQKDFLMKTGFQNVSEDEYVYAKQAIMNTGYKL